MACLALPASFQSLLSDPNTDSPANPGAAAMYKNDRKEYKKRVRKMVERSQDGAFMDDD